MSGIDTGPGGPDGPDAGRAIRDPADAPERVVSPLADEDDRDIEGALRPRRLEEFVGQARVREQLSLVLTGAMRRGRAPDHVRALLGLDDSTTDVIRRATRHWRRRHLRSGAEARHTPDKFRKDRRARMPLAEEAERLQLPPSTPVVEITRTEYAAHGTPVEVNEMTADAGSYVFRYEFAAAG